LFALDEQAKAAVCAIFVRPTQAKGGDAVVHTAIAVVVLGVGTIFRTRQNLSCAGTPLAEVIAGLSTRFADPLALGSRRAFVARARLTGAALASVVGDAVTVFVEAVFAALFCRKDLASAVGPLARRVAGLGARFAEADMYRLRGADVAGASRRRDTFAAFVDLAIAVVVLAIADLGLWGHFVIARPPLAADAVLECPFAKANASCVGGACITVADLAMLAGAFGGPLFRDSLFGWTAFRTCLLRRALFGTCFFRGPLFGFLGVRKGIRETGLHRSNRVRRRRTEA